MLLKMLDNHCKREKKDYNYVKNLKMCLANTPYCLNGQH